MEEVRGVVLRCERRAAVVVMLHFIEDWGLDLGVGLDIVVRVVLRFIPRYVIGYKQRTAQMSSRRGKADNERAESQEEKLHVLGPKCCALRWRRVSRE